MKLGSVGPVSALGAAAGKRPYIKADQWQVHSTKMPSPTKMVALVGVHLKCHQTNTNRETKLMIHNHLENKRMISII